MDEKQYAEAVLATAEEADYSRFPELHDVSQGDLLAAARLMQDHIRFIRADDTDALVRLMRARYSYACDERAFADIDDRDRRFMDRADDIGLSSGLTGLLAYEVTWKRIGKMRERGWFVVELKGHGGYDGFYVFTEEAFA